jgi:hypothetical protein
MPQKKCNFLCNLKQKNPWWPFKKPTKHWSQQNWFANVPKSSQIHHWSKVKAAKLEKINIINIIKGIKLIKFIYTCKSLVEKEKPSLDESYTITSKQIMIILIWRGFML